MHWQLCIWFLWNPDLISVDTKETLISEEGRPLIHIYPQQRDNYFVIAYAISAHCRDIVDIYHKIRLSNSSTLTKTDKIRKCSTVGNVKVFQSRLKVTVKVMQSKFIVPSERSCNQKYICQVGKCCLKTKIRQMLKVMTDRLADRVITIGHPTLWGVQTRCILLHRCLWWQLRSAVVVPTRESGNVHFWQIPCLENHHCQSIGGRLVT